MLGCRFLLGSSRGTSRCRIFWRCTCMGWRRGLRSGCEACRCRYRPSYCRTHPLLKTCWGRLRYTSQLWYRWYLKERLRCLSHSLGLKHTEAGPIVEVYHRICSSQVYHTYRQGNRMKILSYFSALKIMRYANSTCRMNRQAKLKCKCSAVFIALTSGQKCTPSLTVGPLIGVFGFPIGWLHFYPCDSVFAL